jgi:phosphohistidine phosphatase
VTGRRISKRITLLRHAKARPGDDSASDRERPLNERGLHDAPLIGRRLRERGARPSLIITSPATRALHTARLVAAEIGYPHEFLQREADLYLASPEAILGVVARQDNAFNDIMVCGHNPGLTDLANRLTRGAVDDIPTCGVVVIEANIADWTLLSGGGTLVHFDAPRRLDGA